jgi:recombination protein RecA
MNEAMKKLFGLAGKSDITTHLGDDLNMGSIAPYGISSGMAELDLYLGRRGGLPASKVIEYFGKPGCGKTTAAIQAGAEWQKRDGLVVFIDTEMSYTPERARELGCDPEKVFWHEANTIEEIFKTLIYYLGEIDVESKKKSKPGWLKEVGFEGPVLFIIDSTTGVPTIADAQGNIDASDRPGFEAKQIKRGLKKVNPLLHEHDSKPSILFINHSVSKIGGWGKSSDSGGGLGIKFYATVRIEFTSIGHILNPSTKERRGQKVNIEIIKLKQGHLEWPKLTSELMNEDGFDKYESLKLAMVATGFAKRPKGGKIVTVLPDTDYEAQFAQADFRTWVEQQGGYDQVYQNWRRWSVREGALQPWGSEG